MLDVMRRHAKSTAIKILFWIIIAVFVLWGVGSFSGGDSLYAATVNGDTITPRDVRRTALQLERFYQQIYGQNLTPELAKALDFKGRALDQMINASLMRQEATRLGFSVSDEEVRTSIESIEGLNVDGKFQRETYFRYLRSQGMSPAEFEDQQRDRLLVQKMQDLVVGSIRKDEAGARDLFTFQNEKLDLSFLRFKGADFTKDLHPTDAELSKYYDEHKDSFREPERAAIDYLSYEPAKFEQGIQIADADIQAEYDAFKSDRYADPEQVHVRHILFIVPEDADAKKRGELLDKAKAALERVKKGEDFAAVAGDVSEDQGTKDKGGDLGFVSRGRSEPAFETAAFGLAPGTVSDVVESRFGYHLIKVEEKKPAREKTLAEAKDEIVKRLKTERAHDVARDAAFADAEKVSGGKPLQEIATARGLKLESPPAFTQTEEIVGIAKNPELVKSVFATAAGQVGPVTSVADSLLLYRVREKVPSRIPELKDIHDKVQAGVLDEQGATKARERAEAVLKIVSEKKGLDEVAAAEKITVETTGAFTRSGDYVPRIGTAPELKRAGFLLSKDKPVAPQVYVVSSDAVIVVFKERQPADTGAFDKKKDELVKRHLDDQHQSAVEALLQQLKQRARIKVSPTALASA